MTLLHPSTAADTEDLGAWIRSHRVCWEAFPHRESDHDRLPTVGYDVVLSASCVGPGPWDPAGPRCLVLFERLPGQLIGDSASADNCHDARRRTGAFSHMRKPPWNA